MEFLQFHPTGMVWPPSVRGTLVTEGTTIPPGSLVMGNPGRIRRATTDEEAVSIRRYAEHYVSYKGEFQAHAIRTTAPGTGGTPSEPRVER